MVKIKYVGISNSITSGKTQYFKNTVYEVSDKVADYLTRTFNISFEVIEDKGEVKEAPTVTKGEVKEAPTVTKGEVKEAPKQKRRVKKVIEKD